MSKSSNFLKCVILLSKDCNSFTKPLRFFSFSFIESCTSSKSYSLFEVKSSSIWIEKILFSSCSFFIFNCSFSTSLATFSCSSIIFDCFCNLSNSFFSCFLFSFSFSISLIILLYLSLSFFIVSLNNFSFFCISSFLVIVSILFFSIIFLSFNFAILMSIFSLFFISFSFLNKFLWSSFLLTKSLVRSSCNFLYSCISSGIIRFCKVFCLSTRSWLYFEIFKFVFSISYKLFFFFLCNDLSSLFMSSDVNFFPLCNIFFIFLFVNSGLFNISLIFISLFFIFSKNNISLSILVSFCFRVISFLFCSFITSVISFSSFCLWSILFFSLYAS